MWRMTRPASNNSLHVIKSGGDQVVPQTPTCIENKYRVEARQANLSVREGLNIADDFKLKSTLPRHNEL